MVYGLWFTVYGLWFIVCLLREEVSGFGFRAKEAIIDFFPT